MIRKGIHILKYALFLLLSITLLLEIAFRYQWVDFYKAELKALNPSLDNQKNTILVFGDSFTANPNGYISNLRKDFPHLNIINCALPGSGIKQHKLFFEDRIKQFKPQHIIYQFYLGNDFLDIQHPLNWQTVPFWRNVYWQISERLMILQYLNFKLAFLNIPNHNRKDLKLKSFSPELYNKRTQLYLKADPDYLENTIYLKENQGEVYKIWRKYFNELIEVSTSSTTISLLIIPHNIQVNQQYFKRMKDLGTASKNDLQIVDYPLIQQIKSDFPDVNLINPLASFQEAEKGEIRLYYENDPHLNSNGQEILAQFLRKNLFDNN